MKAYGAVNIGLSLHPTSALVGDEWPASRSGRFTPGTALDATGTGFLVDPRAVWTPWRKDTYFALDGNRTVIFRKFSA